uniref:Uncharacterized protein n=1 Tax=Glossina pallidipes TaxID=7398 RepID=A0A1A9ZIY3_GLOPL
MEIIGEKNERNIGKPPDGFLDEFHRCNNEIDQDMLDDISQPPHTSHAGEVHIKTEVVNNKCFDNLSQRNQAQGFETTSYSSLYNVSVRIVEEIDKWIKKNEKEHESTSLTVNENQITEKKDFDLPPNLQPLLDKNSERVLANSVSFPKDVATQTDGNDVFNMSREIDSCDVAAQTMQENRLSEPPLGFVTRNFDSNQMTAMLDFAELLAESRSLDYFDLYNVRQRLLAIYKSSLPPEITLVFNAAEQSAFIVVCESLTVVTRNASRKEGSASSKTWCIVSRITVVQPSPYLTPLKHNNVFSPIVTCSRSSHSSKLISEGLSKVGTISCPVTKVKHSTPSKSTSPIAITQAIIQVYKPGKVLYKEKTPVYAVAKNRNQARMNINNYTGFKNLALFCLVCFGVNKYRYPCNKASGVLRTIPETSKNST